MSQRTSAPLQHLLVNSNIINYAQEAMENIFCDVETAEVYIDDIGAFSHSWDDHMVLLRTILTKLQENGFYC